MVYDEEIFEIRINLIRDVHHYN